ncbi:MAG: DUF5320 domain-containing protein [Deltaproteobacteria bacterium]|nr:DUF5320 domain-containing protein [Deltaproteobacteria bacterium]
MPGGDRTGPLGMGPMTGRAAGFCAGFPVPGYANPVGGRGMGWGRGRGMGRGRGFGRGFGWAGAVGPYPANASFGPLLTPAQELEGLKQQAEFLQSSLSQINDRIEQLEKEDEK